MQKAGETLLPSVYHPLLICAFEALTNKPNKESDYLGISGYKKCLMCGLSITQG